MPNLIYLLFCQVDRLIPSCLRIFDRCMISCASLSHPCFCHVDTASLTSRAPQHQLILSRLPFDPHTGKLSLASMEQTAAALLASRSVESPHTLKNAYVRVLTAIEGCRQCITRAYHIYLPWPPCYIRADCDVAAAGGCWQRDDVRLRHASRHRRVRHVRIALRGDDVCAAVMIFTPRSGTRPAPRLYRSPTR